MQFKLKEADILEYLELNFPQQKFEKGRLLIGQQRRSDLSIFYLGEDFLANVVTKFNTFEYREAVQLDYDMIDKITLKDALLFRKMYIKSGEQTLKFGTSRALLVISKMIIIMPLLKEKSNALFLKMVNLYKIQNLGHKYFALSSSKIFDGLCYRYSVLLLLAYLGNGRALVSTRILLPQVSRKQYEVH